MGAFDGRRRWPGRRPRMLWRPVMAEEDDEGGGRRRRTTKEEDDKGGGEGGEIMGGTNKDRVYCVSGNS